MPIVIPIANPVKCSSFVRSQGQGMHGSVSRSGVLRIVLRTRAGGVSQPSESSDSVPYHKSTCCIVAWYLASRSPSRASMLVDHEGLPESVPRYQLKLGGEAETRCAGSAR